MRIIVIAVSAIVAAALALIALLSDEKETPPTEKQNEEEPRSLAWQTIDFLNGKFLYRQYIRCRGTSKKDN